MNATQLAEQLKKICLEGSGKGRIELIGTKYLFGYESQITRINNIFELVLDFPLIGEKKISLGLNPGEALTQIHDPNFAAFLRDKIGNRSDNEAIFKTIETFFVFTADFIYSRTSSVYSPLFLPSFSNGHLLVSYDSPNYIFIVDNFAPNEIFFERTSFKIFQKSLSLTTPTMTLLLIPNHCDTK